MHLEDVPEASSQDELAYLQQESETNTILLRRMFDLGKVPKEEKTIETLSQMKGLLKVYHDQKTDAVSLLRSIRDEDR